MAGIHLLDEQTANQIAAGEVVERPASVVKELVENALDAGAKRIVVEVSGGGRELIRVTDDGSGMSPADARLALQRHATSKIRSAADLTEIATMGFRGEAIPSIASVSQFELVTRQPAELAGYRLMIEGGTITEEGEHGCPSGTRVTVRNLFYNVPARLKYLKTTATEMGQISDMLTRLALANPDVAMRFQSGQAQVFATPGTGELLDAAAGLLGRELIKELIPVDYQDQAARVWGFVGRPAVARAGRNHQYFFVNRRSVRTINVRYALEEAYAHLLPNGRYPICILFIEVAPQEVDVNVHPAKAEVRFERDREVRGSVYKATRQALGASLLIPGTTITPDGEVLIPNRAGEKAAAEQGITGPVGLGLTPGSPGLTAAGSERDIGIAGGAGTPAAGPGTGPSGWIPPGASRPGEGGGRARQVSFRLNAAQTTSQEENPGYGLPPGGLQAILEGRQVAEVAAGTPGVGSEGFTLTEPLPQFWGDQPAVATGEALIRSLRPLGQVHRSYILCDGPEGLYVVDQHAAHERIFFERLYRYAEERAGTVQPLLFPITLDLTPAQMALWEENAAIFLESGFEAEPFGGNTLLIKGVPSGLGPDHVARLVSDFLDRLQEDRVEPGAGVTQRRQQVVAAMAACKAAIKARDALQPEDITALLADLAGCDSPVTCPHGRPTVICIAIPELEKRFKR